ncbi:MAG: PEP-CTERM sorting domain-containing protein [Acidobacteriota bacterium]|nr:PEP-CTERM sorting domain-containing protein [Acidobacteriota bacterium]
MFTNISTTTTEILNWTNLQSVTFSATTDSGIDNLNVVTVPEPSTWALLGLGLLALIGRRALARFRAARAAY